MMYTGAEFVYTIVGDGLSSVASARSAESKNFWNVS